MVFPRTLTPKGTGLPDFQTAIQSVTGSVRVYNAAGSLRAYGSVTAAYIGRIGTLATGGGGGTVKYANRIGTLQRVGTVRYVQAGSLGYVTRVGTLQRLSSVGTIRNIVAGQDILTGVDVQARLLSGTVLRDRKPLGPGSRWIGSWQDVSNYRKKTYIAHFIGTAGSFAVIVGLTGSGPTHATGTLPLSGYLGAGSYQRRLGKGSYTTFSFEDAVKYTRPFIHAAGTQANTRGSFTVALARQA